MVEIVGSPNADDHNPNHHEPITLTAVKQHDARTVINSDCMLCSFVV